MSDFFNKLSDLVSELELYDERRHFIFGTFNTTKGGTSKYTEERELEN